MEKTLKILALVCHDNICFNLANEQKTICKNLGVFPNFPLICPLKKLLPAEKNKNILEQYQNIFHSLGQKIIFSSLEYDKDLGIFFRNLQIKNKAGNFCNFENFCNIGNFNKIEKLSEPAIFENIEEIEKLGEPAIFENIEEIEKLGEPTNIENIENVENAGKNEKFSNIGTKNPYFEKIILAKTNNLPFLFNEFSKNCIDLSFYKNSPQIENATIFKNINSPQIELRVFKLAIFTFSLKNESNFRFSNWQQENSVWVKMKE